MNIICKNILAMIFIMASSLAIAQAPPNSLSIVDFGATGADTTDDTTPIINTIAAAASQGKVVYVPAGTFYRRDFTLNGVSMTGTGRTLSILYAFNDQQNTVIITGNGVNLTNLQLFSVDTARNPVDSTISIEGQATNFVIDNIIADGGNGASIIGYRASFGRVTNNITRNSLADSIHFTDGSHDLIIANNNVRDAGDDLIAAVSYAPAPAQNYNILIQDNDVAGSLAHGIAVWGSNDITIRGNIVGQTNAAGIFLTTDPTWTQPPFHNVLIENNTISNSSGPTGQGAISTYAFNGPISLVKMQNNTIIEPVHNPIKIHGNTSADNINFAIINNTMTDAQAAGMFVFNGTNIYCSGNTLNGNATTHANCTGVNNFTVTGSSLTYAPGSGDCVP